MSSLAELKPEWALGLLRGHWSIENQHFHVKDDSFREDRQVLAHHHSGTVLSLLSNAALGLLRGDCELWRSKEPLTGRSQRLCAAPPASSHPMHDFEKALVPGPGLSHLEEGLYE